MTERTYASGHAPMICCREHGLEAGPDLSELHVAYERTMAAKREFAEEYPQLAEALEKLLKP